MNLPIADIIQSASFVLKIIFLIASCAIVGISYFHAKEAKKMEAKLSVGLPGSVHIVMTVQLFLSVVFVFLATIFLFLF